MTQTRRRFLITPLERPVLDDFSKQTFSQSGHNKFEKPWQLPFRISEAKARNACYPESWAGYIRSVRRKPSQYLHYNTAKCLNSPKIQPQAVFAATYVDKFEGCTFNINVFCGDQSKIARLNENWLLSDRGTNRHYLHCSCTFGHFS